MAARSKGKSGTSPPTRWLFGPVPDLMFGCGLGYLAADSCEGAYALAPFPPAYIAKFVAAPT